MTDELKPDTYDMRVKAVNALRDERDALRAQVAELVEALEEAIAQRDSCGVGFMEPDRPARALAKAKGGGV